MNKHFWFGEWVDDSGLDEALTGLEARLAKVLCQPFPFADLLAAAEALAARLVPGDDIYERLVGLACETTARSDVEAMMAGIAGALSRDALLGRVRAELGCSRPGVLSRVYPGRQFETWAPLGCVVHVMPANVFSVAALGLMESLLPGNVNVVKVSARDTAFGAHFAEALCRLDVGGRLQDYIAVTHVASKDQTRLQTIFGHADAISAWGGEKAIAAVRQAAPEGARVISWGHKVSFGYVAAECLQEGSDERETTLTGVARDVCRLDQQACSSPQTIFVEADEAGVDAFAADLARRLAEVSPTIPGQLPDDSERAELTTVMSITRAEAALGLTAVYEDEHEGRWRVLVDRRPGLRPSPLYRTIWVKSLARADIATVLRPMRAWLQSCGVACGLRSLAEISRALFSAGITRIARPGEMVDSYVGAPHDGVYALQQLARRISLDGPPAAGSVGSFAELETVPAVGTAGDQAPVLHKAEFQAMAARVQNPDLVFRSGGSGGNPVFSMFSWDDYHDQMTCAAHGLLAAGLEPERDVVMNLFASGYLYGSFISFWTILEKLRARQLPMGMVPEFDQIATAILLNKANVVIGLPSHILGLFEAEGERLRGHVEKIFFGGERMTRSQREYLATACGVQVVRSAAYGSNDAGPLGYQCPDCAGGVHHLMSAIQHLEIVDIEEDRPVAPGQSGRLLFTSAAREYPRVVRYEIGDTGTWVEGECPCGRADPRFDLQGRMGDVFKAGAPFFNARRFATILDEQLHYAGPVQLHIREDGPVTVLQMWISADADADAAAQAVREHYEEIPFSERTGMAFRFEVRTATDGEFERASGSGKVKPVCDHRMN
jgi:phenylacetate-coenzyme A ligase PaaK-like adenylate-forming protein